MIKNKHIIYTFLQKIQCLVGTLNQGITIIPGGGGTSLKEANVDVLLDGIALWRLN